MTIEIDTSTQTGSWMSSRQEKLPAIYAHAGLNTTSDDPVTIFWGGNTSGDKVLGFFSYSVSYAIPSPPADQVFRTLIVSPGEEKLFDYISKIPYFAEFVRFEHVVSNKNELGKTASSDAESGVEADYVVWARLVGVNDETNDSIGVYVRPSRISSFDKLLASFISETILHPMTIQQAMDSVKEIGDNLSKLR